MTKLSINERELLYKFFDISGGYVLLPLYRATCKNKTWTQKIIFEATNIDIYEDSEYRPLSQQKAIEKIIDTQSSVEISKMFRGFYDYVMFNKEEYRKVYNCCVLSFDELADKVDKLITKLKSMPTTTATLPKLDADGLRSLENDLKQKLANQEFDLAIDRLHTYALYYFEKLCKENNLTPNKDPKNHIMFDDMVTQLQKKFENNDLLNNFDKETIKNSKIMLQKYNEIRNNQSYAHPNKIIENAKAKYVVENIISLMNYLGELSNECQKIDTYCQCKNRSGSIIIKGDANISWLECNDCHKIVENSEFDDFPF